jgi:large subunit ribosomal protein L1
LLPHLYHKEKQHMPAGKRYKTIEAMVDRTREYPLDEAIALVKETAKAKFDETVELHVSLGIDPRQSDQQVRSTVMMPNGLGKTVRVLVFAEGDDAKVAEEAGADIIADNEVIARIQNEGWTDFDAALAVPSMMRVVGRLGRILGPRGLMPAPKAGTVVQPQQLATAVQELKSGRVEFRNDKTGNLHMPVGKASFEADKLVENAQAAIDAVMAQKPEALKGRYVRRVTLTATMGPGVRVDLAGLS